LNAARTKNPANCEFVDMLVTTTNEIERERIGKAGRKMAILGEPEIFQFLNEEIRQYESEK
jgi:hypothetical protein